jgi:coenzyme F420 hydrogenase subunit beta
MKVCPGIGFSHQPFNVKTISQLQRSWGPVLEIWEGYATDEEIRYSGSSGGIATALAMFCLENGYACGTLHIEAKKENPLLNTPAFSRSRSELLARTGSRYSPAAPCERFDRIQGAKSACVFIGKPCDVEALRKFQSISPELEKKIGLAISIFCAGTPSTAGTYKLLDCLGVKAEDVSEIRYRGCGWPGMTTVKIKNSGEIRQISYEESWGSILCNYSQFRCHLCPDSTGEFADISCGDPWYRKVQQGELGRSLVLVRTERGRNILKEAQRADYLTLEPVGFDVLPHSQRALLRRRRHLWGRLLVMRIMHIPVPYFEGVPLFSNWLTSPVIEKARSIIGTFSRIFRRNWNKPVRT